VNRAAIEGTIDDVLRGLAGGEPVTALPLTFLLRCYGASSLDAIRDALEPALARALDAYLVARTIDDQASWLILFSDALAMSGDDRLVHAARDLMTAVRRDWGRSLDIAESSVSAEACLRASGPLDAAPVASDAIDELERIVGAAYQPGRGLATGANGFRPRLADQVKMASALLVAYEVSGRLPYAMLPEELMQFARKTWWNDESGCFAEASLNEDEMFHLNCNAACVLCELAGLHADDDYRSQAVISDDAAYGDAARRILAAQEKAAHESCGRSAALGLAMLRYLEMADGRLN